jgi:hypothetical protein
MKAYFAMLAMWEDPYPPLDKVAAHYWNLDLRQAYRRANQGTLPIPAFRASQKSGWRVSLEDLVAWHEAEREKAATLHQRMAG